MLRRAFLRRLSLTAAGLLVADDALELLTHRKVWAGHVFGPVWSHWPGHDLAPIRRYQRIAVDNLVVRENQIVGLFRKVDHTKYQLAGKALVFPVLPVFNA